MSRSTLVAAAALAAAVLSIAAPAGAQLRLSGAVDGVGLWARDAWGGALTVDGWVPAGPLRIGAVLGGGAITSDDDARSRVLMPVGLSLALPLGEPGRGLFFEPRLRAGAWAGATHQGLAVGPWLAGGAHIGYAVGPHVAIGAGLSVWWLVGQGDLLAAAPALTVRFLPFEE